MTYNQAIDLLVHFYPQKGKEWAEDQFHKALANACLGEDEPLYEDILVYEFNIPAQSIRARIDHPRFVAGKT